MKAHFLLAPAMIWLGHNLWAPVLGMTWKVLFTEGLLVEGAQSGVEPGTLLTGTRQRQDGVEAFGTLDKNSTTDERPLTWMKK